MNEQENNQEDSVVLGVDDKGGVITHTGLERREWWVLAAASLVFLVPLLWFWGTALEVVEVAEVPKVCGFDTDNDAVAAAVNKQSLKACDCVTDDARKQQCRISVKDLMLYSQAIQQFNPALCNDIIDDIKKDACTRIVNKGIEQSAAIGNEEQLARTFLANSDSRSVALLESLHAEEPDNFEYLIALAYAYADAGLEQQEQGEGQNEFVEKAFAVLEKAKEIAPEESEVYRAEGYVYEIKPALASAVSSYDKAIELDETNALAYAGRGHAWRLSGALARALADFKKAAELDTGRTVAAISHQLCLLEVTRSDLSADAEIDCALAANDETAGVVIRSEALQVLASLSMDKEDYVSAHDYLTQAGTLTNSDPNLFVTLADLYILEEKYEDAETAAQKAVELSPTKAVALSTLAHALYLQGRSIEAAEVAEQALALVDEDVSLLHADKEAQKILLYRVLETIYQALGDVENEKKYRNLNDQLEN